MPYRGAMLCLLAVTGFPTAQVSAQDPRWDLPHPEHALLDRLVGEWTFERLSAPAEGALSSSLGRGVVSASKVGEYFVVSRWSGTVYGAEYTAVQSLGFDVVRRRYTGDWIDNFLSFRWILSGFVAGGDSTLVISTSGPGPAGGMGSFRERHLFESADAITIIGEMQQGDAWVALTTTRLTRRP